MNYPNLAEHMACYLMAHPTLARGPRPIYPDNAMTTAKTTWEPEQDKWLCTNRSRYTVAELASAYNREAAIQGWPSRTKAAIKQRLSRALQCRTRPYERSVINTDLSQTYRSVAAAATAMGVSEDSIRSAIQRDGLCQGYSWAYLDEWNGDD